MTSKNGSLYQGGNRISHGLCCQTHGPPRIEQGVDSSLDIYHKVASKPPGHGQLKGAMNFSREPLRRLCSVSTYFQGLPSWKAAGEQRAAQEVPDLLRSRRPASACRPVGLSACRPVGLSACRPVGLSACPLVGSHGDRIPKDMASLTRSQALVKQADPPVRGIKVGLRVGCLCGLSKVPALVGGLIPGL